MATEYTHTQPGYLVLAVTGAGTLFAIARMASGASKLKYLPLAAALGGTALAFSSLTIEIRDGELRSHFAAGVPARTVKLAEIESVEVVRNPWYFGWGIKYIGDGWLYNVSGFEAVEIRQTNGERFRLGTDEPEQLRDAIVEAKG